MNWYECGTWYAVWCPNHKMGLEKSQFPAHMEMRL